MKIFVMLFLLTVHSLLSATPPDLQQLGRSLANYKVCSEIAVEVEDSQMFHYYQSMLNDAQFALLSNHYENSRLVYSAWDKSELVLLKIGEQSLLKVCLIRFDALSRKMIDVNTSAD